MSGWSGSGGGGRRGTGVHEAVRAGAGEVQVRCWWWSDAKWSEGTEEHCCCPVPGAHVCTTEQLATSPTRII